MTGFAATREQRASEIVSYENRARAALVKMLAGTGGDPTVGMGPGVAGIGDILGPGTRRTAAAREAYSFMRSWVYVSVDAIARRAASQAVGVGEIENAPAESRRRLSIPSGRKTTTNAPWSLRSVPRSIRERAAGAQELTVYESHPLLDLLQRPNSVQRKFEFIYLSAVNLLITGECYWVGGEVEGGDGDFELWAVPTNWITPKHENGLFTGYRLQVAGQATPRDIPAENVARTYLPDPSDIKSALSPLSTVIAAARVDDHIQTSQEAMFRRGINPNLIVTIGRMRGEDGSLTDRRPVLQGRHRRQIIRAIREIWDQTVSSGDPAILDGLIESVHKLHNTPQEMDWPASGEIVKKRIMQAYKVNPIVVGEITAGNRAQAVEAEKNFCGNAVNPLSSALSETLTEFVGPWYEEGKPVVVWIEDSIPTDPDQTLKEWVEARKNEDVTADEFRAEILGLPPLQKRDDPARLLTQQGGLTGVTALVDKVAAGTITDEQATEIMVATLRLDRATAEKIAGVGIKREPPPAPVVPPANPPPPAPTGEDDGGDADEGEGDEDGEDDGGNDGGDGGAPPGEERGATEDEGPPFAGYGSVRQFVRDIATKSVAKYERRMAHDVGQYFRDSVKRFVDALLAIDWVPTPNNAEHQAQLLMTMAWDADAETRYLKESAIPTWVDAYVGGAFNELEVLRAIVPGRDAKTTAQDIADRLGIDVPDGVAIGRAPQWLQDAAVNSVIDTFQEDYWTDVPATTNFDIYYTLTHAISEGDSIRAIAAEINRQHGAQYSMSRALNVARTEMTGAMNAGHAAGMAQISNETGIPMGKEWVSVLGSTTRPSHAAADGQQTADPDGLFTVGSYQAPYPGHHGLPAGERCNCFPESVRVRGEFVGAVRAWYQGRFAEIVTRAGRRLTVTPNHPIATANGWIAAGQIKQGDYVAAYQPHIERSGVSGSHDQQNEPVAIGQVFEALRLAGRSEIRDRQTVDFDGDAQAFVGDIEVVTADGPLPDDRESRGGQQRDKRPLGIGDVGLSLEFGPGPGDAFGVGSTYAPDAIPGATQPTLGDCGAVLADVPRPTRPLAVGIGADYYATFAQAAGQDRAVVAGFLRQLIQRNAGGVTLDEVVEVRYFDAARDVYDLQSTHGLIVATDPASDDGCGGIIAANCQCTIISSIIMEGLEATIETPPDKPAPDPWERGALDGMDVDKILAGHPGLRTKMEKVDKIVGKHAVEYDRIAAERDALEVRYGDEINRHAELAGPVHDFGSPEWKRQYEAMEASRNRQNELAAQMSERAQRMREIDAERRTKMLKIMEVKSADRTNYKVKEMKPSKRTAEGKILAEYKDTFGLSRSIGGHSDNARAKMKESKAFVNRIVRKPVGTRSAFMTAEQIADGKSLQHHVADPAARAWHSDRYSRSDKHLAEAGISIPNSAQTSAFVHETGHFIESTVPGVKVRAMEFQKYRIARAGTPNRKLKDVFPNWTFEDYEVGNDDDFARAFDRGYKPGRPYDRDKAPDEHRAHAFYCGKNYPDGQTELTSMALQLMYEDPIGFYQRDPEFFKFMMGVCDGTLR